MINTPGFLFVPFAVGVTVTLSLVEGSEIVEISELLYDFEITVMGDARE